MTDRQQGSAWERLQHIYQAAAAAHDGQRCLVAPSPQAREQIKEELAAARRSVGGQLALTLRSRRPQPPGFNDGLIYPGDMFPPGTPARQVRSAAADRAPLSGTLRVIVVLVEFEDQALTNKNKHFENLFFSTGVLSSGSVREYFLEATNGMVNIMGEVVGPYTLPRTIKEYANSASGTGRLQPNARTMARDAAIAADPQVDFNPYDNDGDGFVDAFVVVHAGPGAEATLDVDQIWSHKWVLPGGPYDADGTKIYAYLTVPEDARIGVCCHELGHLLFGFPDLYDVDDSSEGVGNWCLMGSGSWNGNGDTPAHPSAWCKANQGWVTVHNHAQNATVSIADVKTSHTVHRLWKNGASSTEYFLLENRQRTGYDRKLPGDGLLIWHIDESIETNSDETHPKVRLVQADNEEELEHGDNRGDGGDPYPGESNNTTFSIGSSPHSKAYNGADSGVSITNISPSGPVMTAQLAVVPKTPAQPKTTLKEMFDNSGKNILKEIFKEKEKEVAEGVNRGLPAPTLDSGVMPRMAQLEARMAALEARLNAIAPFIDAALRPDLTRGALDAEDDLAPLQKRTQSHAADAKRQFDTKLPDA